MCTQSWLLNHIDEKEDLSELPSDSLATVNEDEDPALIGALSGLALDSDDDSEDE
ncbi:unnamed protein product [Linum tenue]|uniref:Uncharacterized protein n=1 Tax=Linum tenue TaxID=586396 RepID=A0AAV0L6Q3_9ROSI|nr:unnamed protein product [Linum tenue]